MSHSKNDIEDWLRSSGRAVEHAPPEDDHTERQLSYVLPIARKTTEASSQTVTGLYAKNDGSVVPVESGMEADYAAILDADTRVVDFSVQAAPFSYEVGERAGQHFFDFQFRVDECTVYAAVKPKDRQTRSGIHEIVASIARSHACEDRRFIVIDEDHLAEHLVRNARLTNRALKEEPQQAEESDRAVLGYLRSCSIPPQVVDIQIDLDLPGRTLTSVARLVRLGLVRALDDGCLTIGSYVVAVPARPSHVADTLAADPSVDATAP